MSERSIRRSHRRAAERRWRRARVALLASTITGSAGFLATGAQAATYTVLNTNDNGAGSLRAAIEDANAHSGADAIAFDGVSGEITLTSGELEVSDTLTIEGPGADTLTVSGGGASRVMSFAGGSTDDLVLSGLTITDGEADYGGGLFLNGRRITLSDVTVSGNTATAFSGGAQIDGVGVEVTRSTFSGNTAADGFGGLMANGQFVSITESAFTGNEAAYVGGLYAQAYAYAFDSGRLTVADLQITDNDGGGGAIKASAYEAPALFGGAENLTVTGNTATSSVGGLELRGLTLRGATISGNSSADNVGGISLYAASLRTSTVSGNTGAIGGVDAEGEITEPATNLFRTVQIVDSTISGNEAVSPAPGVGGVGGGVAATGELVDLVNSTVAGNRAEVSGGGVYAYDDADGPANPDDDADDTIGLASTIVGDNLAGATPGDLAVGSPDVSFTGSASLIEVPGSAPLSGTGNLTGVDPQLAPLADNGGATMTRLIAATSPAVDAGDANGLTTDQRGLPRTVGGGTDIGSVELQTTPPPPPPPDTTVDATAKAKGSQKVKGKKVKVLVEIDAAEAVDVTASGKVGKQKLKTVETSVGAGSTLTVKLVPAKKSGSKKIIKALKRGKKQKAKLQVTLVDGAGNEAESSPTVRLK